jgi:glyoxylase-like metal-dependent hydrolase (beta-lactamase superfamily II)
VVNGSRVERVLAPNASPMTLEGTNTYVVTGGREAIVIDPGPADAAHIAAIVAAAARRGASIAAIAVTHSHPDHAPGAAPLAARTGAPVYGHAEGRFHRDHTVADGERVVAGDAVLDVFEAPGHASDHLVFGLPEEGALFTGDVVVGRGTVVIAPPSGDMRAYQNTLRRLRDEGPARTIYGGHGDPVADPRAKFDEYIAHRAAREGEILAQLRAGERTIPEMVEAIYRAVPAMLWPAAARQVLAYLIALQREGRVRERRLERAPTAAESALLNPDLSRIVDPESAAVARAELGIGLELDAIEAYSLV